MEMILVTRHMHDHADAAPGTSAFGHEDLVGTFLREQARAKRVGAQLRDVTTIQQDHVDLPAVEQRGDEHPVGFKIQLAVAGTIERNRVLLPPGTVEADVGIHPAPV